MSQSKDNLPTELPTTYLLNVAALNPRLRALTYQYLVTGPDGPKPEPGAWCSVPVGKKTYIGLILEAKLVDTLEDTPYTIKSITALYQQPPALDADHLRLYAFAAGYYRRPIGAVLTSAIPPYFRNPRHFQGQGSRPSLVALLAQGRSHVKAESKALDWDKAVVNAQNPPMNEDQRQVADQAWQAMETGRPGMRPILIHGVTGSGKTRVYIELMTRMWAQDPNAQILVLVPEIGLTPQLEQRMSWAFPAQSMVTLHSAMTELRRAKAWFASQTNQARLILGTRVAILAPYDNLKMIVLDEEHDLSYRQQDGLQYSARDLAVYLAHQSGIPLIMGSATPSLETRHQVQKERYLRLRLPRQATGAPKATVHLIDTTTSPKNDGLTAVVSSAIAQTLSEGTQAMLFLNRRGWAPLLICEACGWSHQCRHCRVPMVLHKAQTTWRLICHHCGLQAPALRTCPDCGATDLNTAGQGIQQLESRLNQLFPGARILRIDRDAVGRPSDLQQILTEVSKGGPGILLGTQMLAKGHDFPALRLVVIVDADRQLVHPDFRAQEWLLSLLVQVAGRAGRQPAPDASRLSEATVMVQTRYPQHPIYQALLSDRTEAYFEQLLKEREQTGLPPYGHLAAIRLRDSKHDRLMKTSQALQQTLTEEIKARRNATLDSRAQWQQTHAYQPAPDYPEYQSGHFRCHIILETPARSIRTMLLEIAEAFIAHQRGTEALIEVDPVSTT